MNYFKLIVVGVVGFILFIADINVGEAKGKSRKFAAEAASATGPPPVLPIILYGYDGPVILNENIHPQVKVDYRYDKDGRLIGAAGKGDFKIDDGFGNISQGIIQQAYKIIGGQAKLFKNNTDMNTKYLDGGRSKQYLTVQYIYDKEGRLQSASGSGKSAGNDNFGNKTESKISQIFLLMQNQTKLKTSRQESQSKNVDGSSKKQDITVTYAYNSKGKMTGASGSGTYTKDDGFGNVETGKIAQKYQVSKGQAKLAKINEKTFEKTIAGGRKGRVRGGARSLEAPPAPAEETATPPAPVEEEVALQHCGRGTWSPTLKRCIEEEAPEEIAPPDCPGGTHWSPTLRSCQED